MERKLSHSQNFLHSQKLIGKLLHSSNITPDDTVVEIGPGKGAITKGLATLGCSIIGIEIDESLYQKLKVKFVSSANVTIIKADFMNYNLPSEEYKVFANIPFNMTAEIIQKLMTAPNRASEIYLIMQYEATLKYAGYPYYTESLRSLMYKPYYEVTIEYEFSLADFSPQPNAKIVLAHFHKKDKSDILFEERVDYSDFLNFVYTAPGRTFKEKTKAIFTYEQQKRLHKATGIEYDAIISEITYPQWLEMFNCYQKYVSAEKKSVVKGKTKSTDRARSKLKKIHRNRNNQKPIIERKKRK